MDAVALLDLASYGALAIWAGLAFLLYATWSW